MQPAAFPMLPRRRLWLTMAGLVLAMLLAALDQTIVGTAMPRIIAELNGFDHYAWVTTAYMLASTAIVPIVGKLSDMYGRKVFLVGGVAFFLFASMLCGLSQDMLQLSLFRGLQGLGAGVLMGTIFTVISILFPPAERGKIQGIFSAVFGFASVAGPLLGGYLTDNLTWRWVFYVNLPVGLIALAVLWLAFTDVRTGHVKGGVDYWGATTLVLAVVPLLLALTWGGRDYAWTSPQVIGLLALAAVMFGSLLVIESRVAEPIIPLDLFKNRVVTMAIIASSLMSVGMFGVIVYLPLFIQAVMGTTATESGTVLAPMMVSMFGASIAAGQIVSRTGRYKAMGVGGLFVGTIGLGLLAVMPANADYGTILRNMLVVGIGIGCTFPVFVVAAQNATGLRQIGVVTSLSQFCRQIGATLGIAVFGSVLVSRFTPAFHDALAPNVAASVPPEWLARFGNPQALVNPEALAQIQQGMTALGPGGAQAYQALLDATRIGFATSLHEVFLAGAVLLACGTVASLFVPELPLKRYERGAPPVEAMAPPAPSAADGEAAERAVALTSGGRGAPPAA